MKANKLKHTLIVLPPSIIRQWMNEFSKFAPEIKIILNYGESRPTKEFIEKRLSEFPSLKSIKIIFTSQKDQSASKPATPPNLKIGSHPKNKDVSLRPELIGKIIAIGSGKGGVGKSTFVSNLAVELDNRGFTVGIIDADMHGPSQPTLLGSTEKPQINPETKKIIPTTSKSIKFINMSAGEIVAKYGR